MMIELLRLVGFGEFGEGLGHSIKAKGVELVEGRMFEQAIVSSMIVARAADVGVKDRGRLRGAFWCRPPIELVVENGFDGCVRQGGVIFRVA